MTGEERVFAVALLVSLGAHAFFTGLIFSLPEKEPEEKIVVYTVRILEVPPRPKVRKLSLSTSAISALKLQSPTLKVKSRPPSVPAPPGLPESEIVPITGPSFKGLPAPSFKGLPVPKAGPSFKGLPVSKASPSLFPPPPESSKSVRQDFQKPSPQGVLARPKNALPGRKSVFPQLPETPKRLSSPLPPETPGPGQSRPVLRRPAPSPVTPARPPGGRPPPKSLMERTRERVQTLKLDIQALPPSPKRSPNSPPAGERNLVSLRRYSNSVARAVKKDYTFPGSGGFKSGLRARVRLALNRDGSVQSIDMLESSGNPTFDQVVCRSKIFRTKMPPVPEDIPDDPLVLMITCKP